MLQRGHSHLAHMISARWLSWLEEAGGDSNTSFWPCPCRRSRQHAEALGSAWQRSESRGGASKQQQHSELNGTPPDLPHQSHTCLRCKVLTQEPPHGQRCSDPQEEAASVIGQPAIALDFADGRNSVGCTAAAIRELERPAKLLHKLLRWLSCIGSCS
jgi:hypothetical protein